MPLARRLSALDRRYRWWFSALLVGLTLALYAPAIHFGLMWDDPRIYQATSAVSPWWKAFIIPSPPTDQYYRPLAVLYSQLMVTPPGRVNAPLAHLLHMGVHLVILLALVPLLRGLRFSLAHARLTALCFALFPPSYFDIAWHQTQQPLMMVGLMLAIAAAQKFCQHRQRRFLLFSLLAYGLGLFVFEGGAPYVFAFFWLAWDQARWRQNEAKAKPGFGQLRALAASAGWAVWHLALTGLYLFLWLSLPLHRSVTGSGFQIPVLAYLTQGMVFPIAQAGAGALAAWPADRLAVLFLVMWALLSLGLWKWHSGRSAVFGNLWVAAGMGPLWAGLSWEYARDGARLLYPAALGIAVVWGGWMALLLKPRLWQRAVGGLVLAGIVGGSLWQFARFQQMFETSTHHLARAVAVLSAAPQQRLLFVNFPDQLNLSAPVYPLGNWGVIQAPVVQNLSDYALALKGQSALDSSLSASSIGADDRAAWPYRVDMRGLEATPDDLFQAAEQAEAVYLTDYLPGAALRLRAVGAVRPASASAAAVAQIGDFAQLAQAEVVAGDAMTLRLVWRCQKPPGASDTIFVHLWKEGAFVGGADGGSLGNLIPLFAWRPGRDIVDLRRVEVAALGAGSYEVRVGIYNLSSGERYPAIAADGSLYPEGEVTIGSFTWPDRH